MVCQILFVPDSETKRLEPILRAVEHRSVLTVGESADFLARGGMIRLVVVEGRVRFAVNLGGAEAVGLKLSSRLLSSALAITDERRR